MRQKWEQVWQRSSASANCNDEQVGKNRQAGPGREREKERGKERTNPAHDSTPPSTSASRRSRRRRLTRTVEIVDERAVQDVPGRDPPPLLRTVPLPIHQKLVAPPPRTNVKQPPYPVNGRPLVKGRRWTGGTGGSANNRFDTGYVKYGMNPTQLARQSELNSYRAENLDNRERPDETGHQFAGTNLKW